MRSVIHRRLAFGILFTAMACGGEGRVLQGKDTWTGDDGDVQSELTQCSSATSYVTGVDVAYYQGNYDFVAAKAAGYQFAFAKATQGLAYVDPKFSRNWAAARSAGVIRGAYHFFEPDKDGVAQANHFLATVGTLGADDLPPVLDAECPSGSSTCLGYAGGSGYAPTATILARMLDFFRTVEAATGKTPILYTGNWWLAHVALADPSLARYPLWDYAGNADCFSVPSPWKKATFRQILGGSTDVDRFTGTYADLLAFARAGVNPNPNPGPTWDCAQSSYQGKQYWTCSNGDLHECQNGTPVKTDCAGQGCKQNPVGTDDTCNAVAPPPPSWDCNRSSYQGKQFWTCSSGDLYECQNGTPAKVDCGGHGCKVNAVGTDDACNAPNPVSWSCSRSAWNGQQYWTCSSGDLYECQNGTPVKTDCAGQGCIVGAAGTNDVCRPTGGAGGCNGSASGWVWPVPARHNVVQRFGNPIQYQSCGFHTGIDISGSTGDSIVAAGPGKVAYVGPLWLSAPGTGRGPYAIIIDHGGGVFSTYSHDSAALVQAGDCVIAGQQIARVGSLGYSSGPHLHFEVLTGTAFTGSWQTPFASACTHYVDPLGYVKP